MPDAERAPRREFAWVLLLLLLPFGEGGATPGALFWVHTLILLVAFLELALPGSRLQAPSLLPPDMRTAAPLFSGLAVVASLETPYPYASFLRCWDLAIALVVLVLSRRADWGRWTDH